MKQIYYFIDVDGKNSMPVVRAYFKEHGINPMSWVWFDGLPEWVEARDVPSLEPYLSNTVKVSYANVEREDPYLKPPKPKLHNGSMPEAKTPRSWLFEAIVVTILCFMPFGIVSIIYAARVKPLWKHLKYADAVESSLSALLWAKWSFAVMLFFWLIVFLVSIIIPESLFIVDWNNANWLSDI
ncbi:MAG: CD225/dispanin family protein [Rikenellaceae bacterium]